MVISSSNRSPSPMSMRSNPNPNNSRNDQEQEGIGVRKSFHGYPFAKSTIVAQPRSLIPNTPANSPAEYARRSSFGRECGIPIQEHDQKENERDPNLKPVVARVRSPSVSKGTKNFMSPTISAASKVNPSPRKKVLGERNEAIRTSASLSEGKFHFYSTNSLELADENEPKPEMVTPHSKISDFNKSSELPNKENKEKVADLSELDMDSVVLSPELPSNTTKSSEFLPLSDMPKVVSDDKLSLDVKNSTFSSPSTIAPLDADPFIPPYDPKTNFLSPRPQFLHYKPNPRIESYINQGIKFEDDFSSNSASETGNSEELQSEEASSSVGTSPFEEKSSSSELSSPKIEQLEETNEPRIQARPWFSGMLKTVIIISFILLGFISFFLHSPGVGKAIYSNPNLVADLAKENFNGVFENAKVWSAQYVGYLSQMVVYNKEREVKFSSLPVSNFTGWQEKVMEDYLVKDFQMRPSFDSKEELELSEGLELKKFDDFEAEIEEFEREKLEVNSVIQEFETENFEEVKDSVIQEFESEKFEENSLVEDSVIQEFEREKLEENAVFEDSVIQEFEREKLEENAVFENSVIQEFEREKLEENAVFEDSVIQEFEREKLEENAVFEDSIIEDEEFGAEMMEEAPCFIKPEIQEAEHNNEEHEITSAFEEEHEVSESSVVETADENAQIVEESEGSLAPSIAAVSLIAVSLLTAIAFKFAKKPKKNNPKTVMAASKINPKVQENNNPAFWSEPVEVDMVGESCPSELSSFQKTSSFYKNNNYLKGSSDEAQSVERSSKVRNHKRESLASSSSEYTMCSSYGSFTTYSILHSKHRDDEVVTPVRRSSRIRSKVTSP